MAHDHATQNGEPESPRLPPANETIRLTVEQVARIHSRRLHYLLLYGVLFLLQVYVQFGLSRETAPDPSLQIVGFTFLALFYLQFIRVLRTMAYPWSMCIPICLLVILPIPGLIVLAFTDRTMAKALRKGAEH